jgi:8-oxo-dGTP diphosphatase
MAYTYKFPRPSVTVDCVIFGLDESSTLKVLLIQRAHEPFRDRWALPGGFVDMDEPLETAALRELEEETGVKDVFIEQLYTFGDPNRDPRGRVISVAYYALVNLEEHPVKADSDARNVEWFDIDHLPKLAFDHDKIMKTAIKRLRTKVRYQPIGFELLPEKFTLTQLQDLYETILGVKAPLNKRNFRTRILKMGVLREVGKQEGVAHRPAKLYTFDREQYQRLVQEKYEDLLKRGVDFEI